MKIGWTGGQYSLFRAVLGIFLIVQFVSLIPWIIELPPVEFDLDFSNPWVHYFPNLFFLKNSAATVVAVLISTIIASVFLTLGLGDRVAAVWIWYILCCLNGQEFMSLKEDFVLMGLLLIIHTFLPPRPYGSWMASGREDPGGNWKMPLGVYLAAWVILVMVYLRIFYDSGGFNAAMIFLHILTFNPAWIRPTGDEKNDTVFYDGHCGLCHRTVRFLLAEDTSGVFVFSPLQGDTFEKSLSLEERQKLPDSIVVRTASGTIYVRFVGFVYLIKRLGGIWRALGSLLSLVPRPLGDFGYKLVAKYRLKFFKRPENSCPLIPKPLSGRFLP